VKTGKCRCRNRIFFNNHTCRNCSAALGRCTACGALTSLSGADADWTCDACGASVSPCSNQTLGVCNSFNLESQCLCKWCQYTAVLPDLSQPDNGRLWAAMESAKRRLLIQLEELGLPPFAAGTGESHPLSFQFMAETTDSNGNVQPVTTGHQNGVITIDLAEANSVHRERLRVRFGEPHRTLIGHLRHEVGHYIEWAWEARLAEGPCRGLFGDPGVADYSDAMEQYYQQGPPGNWEESFVSAYATMHPWEDFAETVNVYLDISAIATTANDLGGYQIDISPGGDADSFVKKVLNIVIEVSEYNFDLGLSPLLPENLPPKVMSKLAFIHSLRSEEPTATQNLADASGR